MPKHVAGLKTCAQYIQCTCSSRFCKPGRHNNMRIDQAGQRHVSARSGQSATGCCTLDATRTLDLFNPKTFASIRAVLPLSLSLCFLHSLSIFRAILAFCYEVNIPTSKGLLEGALNCTWGRLVSVRHYCEHCLCCAVCNVTVRCHVDCRMSKAL